jgi:hypothetical protein
MAQGTLSPDPKLTFFDNNGVIIPGGLVFTYAAGTTTKQATYSDVALSVPNTNPIVLDSAGRCTIFLTPGQSYKFAVSPANDTDPPSSPYWTQDNIASVPTFTPGLDVLGTAGVNITLNQTAFLSDGSGGLNAGQWYVGDSTNGYSSSLADSVGFATASVLSGQIGSFRLIGEITGFVGLSAGTLYYMSTAGGLTSVAPTNARAICQADSSTSAIIGQFFPGAALVLGGFLNATDGAFFTTPPQFYAGNNVSLYSVAEGVMGVDTTQYASINGTTDLAVVTIPANVLSAVGKCIRVTAFFTTATNGNAKTLTFYWNGVSVFAFTATGDGAHATFIYTEIYIYKTGSNTQRISGHLIQYGSNSVIQSVGGTGNATGSATDTGAIVLKFTAIAGGTTDIIQQVMIEENLG